MSNATRREQGIVRNLANQLSQMAAGWEISFDGPALVGEADAGEISIDVVEQVALVNGRRAHLGMTAVLHDWMARELLRRDREWTWIIGARVTIKYSRSATPFSETKYEMSAAWAPWADHGLIDAIAQVSTGSGDAEAASHNSQPLLRVLDLPERGPS